MENRRKEPEPSWKCTSRVLGNMKKIEGDLPVKMEREDKRVGSIKETDLSDLRFPVIAVYRNPEDYKGKCVARIFDINKPTDTVMVKDTLEEIHEDIRKNTHMAYIVREPDDLPSLEGVWI